MMGPLEFMPAPDAPGAPLTPRSNANGAVQEGVIPVAVLARCCTLRVVRRSRLLGAGRRDDLVGQANILVRLAGLGAKVPSE